MPRPILYSTIVSQPCRAVLLTAESIGLELEVREISLVGEDQLKESYQKINPQHTVPTLDDNGDIIWDSHAIMCYLVEKYGQNDSLYPKDLKKRALVDQRLHFDSGILFSLLRQISYPIFYDNVKIVPEEKIKLVKEGYDFLSKFLEGKKWLAGDSYTLADISCVTTLTSLNALVPIDVYPNIVRWVKTCEDEIQGYARLGAPGNKLFREKIQGHFLDNLNLNMPSPILYTTDISPPCRAVLLTAEAIGLKLEKRETNLFTADTLKENFQEMNPQHTVPTLDDNGDIIWDSHAIICYLSDKYGKDDSLYPKDLKKRALINQRLHFDSGILFALLRGIAFPIFKHGVTTVPEDKIQLVKDGYHFMNKFLSGKKWLAGDSYTLADISCVSSVSSMEAFVPVAPYANVARWLKTCEDELPEYARLNVPGNNLFHQVMKSKLQQ
ncbi:uncharacterized protein LOC107038840 [Diachasma alloeum]|uniref:uncharacterized protein LOC107038840 n=1 Tax=Diachasma alloeum TaxID=454923 RepID=UPI0010FBA7BB|nr:uncharacterized protein LOC107038840 [Diachasma alloeum]